MKYFFVLLMSLSFPVIINAGYTPQPAASTAVTTDERAKYNEVADRFNSMFKKLSRRRGFNGNVLVSLQGNIIYEKSFGYSDRRKRRPLNTRSVFELASVSKQFTAVAIMMLYEEDKLDYDDPVAKYFPGFPYEKVTIRHLLSHRSGLPDYLRYAKWFHRGKRGYLTNKDIMNGMIECAPPAEFPPDDRYRYSNTGYTVLALIIEKVSGMSYDRFMSERIFKPLDMKNTFVFNPSNDIDVANRTKGYSRRGRRVWIGSLNGVVGDKGIYSTIEDMFKWDQGLYTDRIIKQSTLEKAYIPYSYDEVHETDYGFGWRIETLNNGEKIVFHTGWWGGYNSLFLRRLSDHTAIVVLSNRVNWSFQNIENLIRLLEDDEKS
jgi:CubicO group peptidase (beta-lactamase class C family)